MSLYAQAASSGMSSLQLMATGENAATKTAYNQAYAVAAQRSAIQNARHTAQLNISAIERDKILSNTAIQLKQNQAKAMILVNAAAAGVEGGSVNDTINETEKNESLAISMSNQRAEQAKESQLAAIGSQSSSLLAIQDTEISLVGEMMKAFSSFELEDLRVSEALNNKPSKEK